MNSTTRIAWAKPWLYVAAVAAALVAGRAGATEFQFGSPLGEAPITGVLNTTITMGVGVRMESRSDDLVGKSNLDPSVCAPPYQSCQGLFREQTYPAEHLFAAPGMPSLNNDDGNLNYDKGDVFQAPGKVTQDLTLRYNDFGFFGRMLYFHDFVNADFEEYHPNRITRDNVDQVGRVGTTLPVPVLDQLTNIAGELLPGGLNATSFTGRFYGPGGVVRSKRSDHEAREETGGELQLMDAYFFGNVDILEREVTIKVGRMLANWGESTTLQINSVNSANPANANNFMRVGQQVEEVLTPIGMIDVSTTAFANLTVEGYYQLEWQPTVAPAAGSYFSDTDVGSNNSIDHINATFGASAEDPECIGRLLDNPLSGLTATCATIRRERDWKPRTSGQYGIKLDYYAENINSGTNFSFSYQNYHSRLPYVSLFSAYPSCMRREGNARGVDAIDIVSTILNCPNIPELAIGNARDGSSSALQLDTARFVLEYPEDIHLFGLSFNTSYGDYSFQGEVAYRPNKPMQIDTHDLAFASLGTQGAACGLHGVQCEGTSGPLSGLGAGGLGYGPNGGPAVYGSSDAVDANGDVYMIDTFNLIVGHATGAQRYFPNFVVPYRGGTVGENPPCYPEPGSDDEARHGLDGFEHPYYEYNRSSPCYIRGYERFDDYQINFGATRVMGATENWIGADQIVLLYEAGAEWVPGLPAYDELVLQGPGVNYGPTAGADGSGADGSRAACSTINNCSYGPDGLRFNPHQQDRSGYPDSLSWGYRIVGQMTYEQIVTGITLRPTIILSHDVQGTSPGPAGNFVAGRKIVNGLAEFRYHQALTLALGYTWFFGGSVYNTLADRDFAQAFVRYQF